MREHEIIGNEQRTIFYPTEGNGWRKRVLQGIGVGNWIIEPDHYQHEICWVSIQGGHISISDDGLSIRIYPVFKHGRKRLGVLVATMDPSFSYGRFFPPNPIPKIGFAVGIAREGRDGIEWLSRLPYRAAISLQPQGSLPCGLWGYIKRPDQKRYGRGHFDIYSGPPMPCGASNKISSDVWRMLLGG